MKKVKVLNVISLILNIAIIAFVMYPMFGLGLKFKEVIVYFTVLSNLFVALASLICIPFNIRGIISGKPLPKLVSAIKLAAVMCVTITIGVVCIILAPANGMNYVAQFGNFSFTDVQFFFHLLVPVISIISFLFFDISQKTKWPINFLSIVPVTLYGIAYIINFNINRVKRIGVDGTSSADWYGMFKQSLAIGILMFAGIIVVAFLLSLLFWLINKKISASCVKEVAENVQEAEPEEDSSKEEAPEEEAEEEQKEEPERKVITARLAKPKEEQAPVQEEKEEAEPEQAEEEPAEEQKEEEPVQEEKKEPEKKAPAKKAPAKKAAPEKKEEVPAPAKEEPTKKEPAKKAPAKKAPAKKEEPAKKAPAKKEEAPSKDDGPTKVYHLTKRKEDGMWAITFVGGQKAVKLFKTKKEAEEYLATLTKNQGATALIRNSKGAKAGKFASSIKNTDDKK